AEQILNTAGYRVTAAAHGGEALDIAQRQTRMPDLVLSDIIMPVMDGATLAQRLRQIWPDVPVLLISGSRSENELAEVLRHPNVDFMPKPFSPEQLLERVGKLLQSAPGDRA
ncbi:MAG: response regulator, partial [Phycisphaeraceae bacterium]